jgi:Fe2+ or Zn2+ uptake regulation protein
MTREEIASTVYPGLTLAQVYAALAYYEDHRGEIDRAFEDEARFLEQFRRAHPELVCRKSGFPA